MHTFIHTNVQAADAWGLEIKRYEITEISPDKFITEAMDKQAAAERERRKKVLEAEGDKRAAELESEGQDDLCIHTYLHVCAHVDDDDIDQVPKLE